MWTFKRDFLKNVNLDLKIVGLNVRGSVKRGSQLEKYGPLCVSFLIKWGVNLRTVDLYA